MKGTILLAVDHAKVSQRAAEMTADLAATGKNKVVVLHVHQIATGRWGQLVIDREPEGECIAEQIGTELRQAGVDTTAVSAGVAMGHVGVEIARIAEREDASLVVMGTHSESDLTSITLGSTSHRVLHLANRPIMFVPA